MTHIYIIYSRMPWQTYFVEEPGATFGCRVRAQKEIRRIRELYPKWEFEVRQLKR